MSDVRPSESVTNSRDRVPVVPQVNMLAQALAIARDIYSGPIEVEEEFDSEYPEYHWRLIVVRDVGSLQEIMARSDLWHRRMILELPAPAYDITIRVLPTLT